MNKKIVIIGAGVSGLVAAIELERQGFSPRIIEQQDRVGGRVKTDYRDGFQYDHGFQVLLTQYPAAKKYLDYNLLDLQAFDPGSAIFFDQTNYVIGDPSRKLSFLLPTLFAKIGSVSDKLKILQLSTSVKKKSYDDIFLAEEKTTLQYLLDYGFSKEIIDLFFKPFFTGIYLEDALATSSRKFEFVYKMFAEGNAAIPKKGIQAIPNQLAAKLKTTPIEFNTSVKEITDEFIILQNGQVIDYDYCIIATEASSLIANLHNQETKWKSVENLYFEVKNKVIKGALIGLIAEKDALVNNIYYVPSSLKDSFLLSVSVVKQHAHSLDKLIPLITHELKKYCEIEVLEFKKYFQIKKALPILTSVNYMMPPSETQLKERIFLAGDVLSNGSLNAAMLNGESAARAVAAKIKDGFININ